uniref:Uncharacterized protein n=1 Tax=Megaselia scalaris TaxID=36166 RepID=T1GU15_MEGSC
MGNSYTKVTINQDQRGF